MPSTRARSQLFQSDYVKIEDMYITKNGTLGDGSSGDVIETDGSGNLRWVAKTEFTLGDLSDFNAAGTTGQILTLQSDDTFAMEWYSWNDITDKPTTLAGYGITDSFFDGSYSSLTGAPTTVSSFTNDSGYITGYTVTESDVTAHQAALSITKSQISDLSITESQISDLQDYLTSVALNDVTDVSASASTAGQLLTAQSDGTFAFETLTTDEVGEGSTNLYFTNDRAKAILSSLDRSIIPATDSLYNLGSGTKKWANLYVDDIDTGNIDVSSNLTVQNLTLNATGTITGIDLDDLGDVDTASSSTGQVLTKQSDGTFEFENIPAVSWNNVQDKPTLPDYSQGTWTPVPKDASNNQGTSSGPQGKYTRVGNQVTVWCDVTNVDTSLLTGTNELRIYTLPYSCNNDVKASGLAQITGLGSNVPDGTIYAQVAEGNNYVTFKVMGVSTDYTIKVQDFTDDTSDIFGFTLTYYTTESV